ncbi:Na+/H+ antiporter NhaA [Luminiphilus syltensis NOR5-1B]|uniref:Na(+)/H(+) antiporter NhaA n=1 Tax=Luminiphilus syltensis NOR5-1B TaxID=565045 RepID=B8KTV7_9GAMM|nr:Na+/H+ antiporter NhaA [Luminiphilus syltensis]EED36493.1 Na+/H+ antiporter NhaA [Luminiphilus syltensis NOR5-1B]
MPPSDDYRNPAPLEKPVEKLLTPLERFVKSQTSSGILLALAVTLALFLANSSYADVYTTLKHLSLSISLGDWAVSMSLRHWINDGLMVFFFFLLGLEIKREVLAGELRDVRQSGLVFCMAAGGMIFPAVVYLTVNGITGADALRGWGIPMATDTAFALGILAALGARVPHVALVILSALAIVDDIGAVLVISIFYSEGIVLGDLYSAAACYFGLIVLNLTGHRRPPLYILLGVALWWFVLQSGVHATTAGILTALAVPARPYASKELFKKRLPRIIQRFKKADDPEQSVLETQEQEQMVDEVRQVADSTLAPLQRWETSISTTVMLMIVPVFAFLNAGVALPGSAEALLESPVSIAVAAGLVVGKGVGIVSFAWFGIRLGIGTLPKDLNFHHVTGLALLAGIGFTMSLFISSLAFEQTEALQDDAKIGILVGSLAAAIIGTTMLLVANQKAK